MEISGILFAYLLQKATLADRLTTLCKEMKITMNDIELLMMTTKYSSHEHKATALVASRQFDNLLNNATAKILSEALNKSPRAK